MKKIIAIMVLVMSLSMSSMAEGGKYHLTTHRTTVRDNSPAKRARDKYKLFAIEERRTQVEASGPGIEYSKRPVVRGTSATGEGPVIHLSTLPAMVGEGKRVVIRGKNGVARRMQSVRSQRGLVSDRLEIRERYGVNMGGASGEKTLGLTTSASASQGGMTSYGFVGGVSEAYGRTSSQSGGAGTSYKSSVQRIGEFPGIGDGDGGTNLFHDALAEGGGNPSGATVDVESDEVPMGDGVLPLILLIVPLIIIKIIRGTVL